MTLIKNRFLAFSTCAAAAMLMLCFASHEVRADPEPNAPPSSDSPATTPLPAPTTPSNGETSDAAASEPQKDPAKKAIEDEQQYERARMAFLFGYFDVARDIWLPLAYQGNQKAQADLGWMYQTGKGVEKDYKKAYDWYLKAANQGHPIAQNNLGVMYEKGWGLKANLKRAAYWYRESAEVGYSYAQFNYGRMLLEGSGISKDTKEAAFWIGLAAVQGVNDAKGLLIDKTKWGSSSEHVTNSLFKPKATDPKQQPVRELLRDTWIMAQNPENYTLQLISQKDENTVSQYASTHPLPDQFGFFKSVVLGETWYAIIYGSYPSFDAAKQQLNTLPIGTFHYKPWIRKFADIQKAIKEPIN